LFSSVFSILSLFLFSWLVSLFWTLFSLSSFNSRSVSLSYSQNYHILLVSQKYDTWVVTVTYLCHSSILLKS
jgi:hypothetical protein